MALLLKLFLLYRCRRRHKAKKHQGAPAETELGTASDASPSTTVPVVATVPMTKTVLMAQANAVPVATVSQPADMGPLEA